MNTPSLRAWLIGCLFGVLLVAGSPFLLAQDIPPKPNPPRLVNDFVGILSNGEQNALEQKLRSYNDSTSSQIIIVIVKTTGDYPPGDYAFEVGKRWGVGQKDKDNGLVLLWATDDRKVFIATGRGLEGAIPDAIAKRIITNIITPNFKNQAWYQGLDEATTEIIKRATGEYTQEAKGSGDGGSGFGIVFIIIILVFLFIIISNRRGGGGRNNGGYRPGGAWFPPIIITGSGSSSGGWGGGGGSSFGGFGGGDFGGGGAGGDY